jgi:dihydroorotase-like cyclic amidohydrolase
MLVSFKPEKEILAQDLRYQHKISPFIGRALRAQVQRTWLRGKQISGEGLTTEPKPNGKLVKPLKVTR